MNTHLTIAGETLVPLPERALYWPRRNALLVADTHWGKATTFRAAGIAIPPGTTSDDLRRLDRALEQCNAACLVLLGDALHARTGRDGASFELVTAWRKRWPNLEITLVRGNHDRGTGDPPPEWGFMCVDAPLLMPPFALCHEPVELPEGYVLAGHLHPVVQLRGMGRQRERLPCFWFGARVGVLPAFGSFTGGATITPSAGERVFVVAGDELVEVSHG